MSDINIVLVEPQIPQNTGNVARTCAATGAALHIVHPMGFEITDSKLKRAGLDYWHMLDLTYHESLREFMLYVGAHPAPVCPVSTKAAAAHTDLKYQRGCYIVFGKETAGLPEDFIRANLETAVRIPMIEGARSLNLSNSVAVIAYEALRQLGYPGLLRAGKFGP